MLNKKLLLVLVILSFFIITPALATDVGCCQKKNSLTGVILKPENSTKENCDKYNADNNQENNDNITSNWNEGMEVIGGVCQKIDRTPSKRADSTTFTPQVDIPGSQFTAGKTTTIDDSTSLLADYIIAIFKYSIGIIGIISAVVLMFAGIRWLTAGGNSSAVKEAKTYIGSSLTGLLLTLCSFLLLSTINPKLTNLNVPAITRVQYIPIDYGCCLKVDKQDKTKVTTDNLTEVDCNNIDYAVTSFFKDYVAKGNTCVPNKGCCVVAVYKKIDSVDIFQKNICYENKTQQECEDENSNWFKLLISGNLGLGDKFMSHYAAPLTCKEDVATIKKNACSEIRQ